MESISPLVDEKEHHYKVCKTTRRALSSTRTLTGPSGGATAAGADGTLSVKFCVVCTGASEKEALTMLRMEQEAGSLARYQYLPVAYYLKHCSTRVQERLVAPLRWTKQHHVFPTVEVWQCALQEWYALP